MGASGWERASLTLRPQNIALRNRLCTLSSSSAPVKSGHVEVEVEVEVEDPAGTIPVRRGIGERAESRTSTERVVALSLRMEGMDAARYLFEWEAPKKKTQRT